MCTKSAVPSRNRCLEHPQAPFFTPKWPSHIFMNGPASACSSNDIMCEARFACAHIMLMRFMATGHACIPAITWFPDEIHERPARCSQAVEFPAETRAACTRRCHGTGIWYSHHPKTTIPISMLGHCHGKPPQRRIHRRATPSPLACSLLASSLLAPVSS